MSYNGWPNYETWSVVLLINNVESWHHYARDLAATVYSEWRMPAVLADFYNGPENGPHRREVARRGVVADAIEEWIRDQIADAIAPIGSHGDDPAAMLASQLVGAALDDVEWRLVADAMLEDNPEAVADEGQDDEDDDQ